MTMPLPLSPGFAQVRRLPLVLFVILYTAVTGGPLLWVATMSLRTTAEIFKNPYGWPSPAHWEKFADAQANDKVLATRQSRPAAAHAQ